MPHSASPQQEGGLSNLRARRINPSASLPKTLSSSQLALFSSLASKPVSCGFSAEGRSQEASPDGRDVCWASRELR
jgi:hypothetical protein